MNDIDINFGDVVEVKEFNSCCVFLKVRLEVIGDDIIRINFGVGCMMFFIL